MKPHNLKIQFIISIMFHSVMLFSIAAYPPNLENVSMDITPVEVIKIPEEKEAAAEPIVEKKENPKLLSEEREALPEPIVEKKEEPKPLPEKKSEEKVEEVKKEIVPIEKKEEVKAQEAKVEQPPMPLKKKEEPKVETPLPPPLPPPPVSFSQPIPAPTIPIPAPSTSSPLPTPASTLAPPPPPIAAPTPLPSTPPLPPPPVVHPPASASKTAEEGGSKYGVEGGTGKTTGDELKLFKTMVRTKIERAKFYPRWARQRSFEGVVGVKFTIQPDGSVKDVNVIRPCHCDVLNKSACEAIAKAAPFNPRPNELKGKEMAMEIDISFKLE